MVTFPELSVESLPDRVVVELPAKVAVYVISVPGNAVLPFGTKVADVATLYVPPVKSVEVISSRVSVPFVDILPLPQPASISIIVRSRPGIRICHHFFVIRSSFNYV